MNVYMQQWAKAGLQLFIGKDMQAMIITAGLLPQEKVTMAQHS